MSCGHTQWKLTIELCEKWSTQVHALAAGAIRCFLGRLSQLIWTMLKTPHTVLAAALYFNAAGSYAFPGALVSA